MNKILFVLAIAALLSACSIKHPIVKDYPEYLANNVGESNLPSTTAASGYVLTPDTIAHHYEFRSGMAGYANVWVVEFGKLLDDTLKSHDVQAAFGTLVKVEDDANGEGGGLLVFDLKDYTFADFGAHVWLMVTYRRSGHEVFSKLYEAGGETQGGKMFWGGAFAMKNAVQQSTKLALDEILRKLIADLNAGGAAAAG